MSNGQNTPQEIIKARIKDEVLDDAPIWVDISTLDGSQLRGMVDGFTHRVDRLKATGNGVIPGVVAAFLR